MVKRNKLTVTGNETDVSAEELETGAAFNAPNSENDAANPVGNEPEADEADTEADTEADKADQEAAGVADKPTRAANGSNQQAALSPKKQYDKLKKDVMAIGAQNGAGKVSMIALAEIVTEHAQDGVLTVEQVPEIYDKFREGVAAKSQYEDAGEVPDEAATGSLGKLTEDKSREQQLSKLRQFVHLGIKYEGDSLPLIQRARNMHIGLLRQALASPEAKAGVKPGSTYAILVDVARGQLKKHKDALADAKAKGIKSTGLAPVLTDDELYGIMSQEVKEKIELTSEEKLLQTYLAAISVRDGTAKRGPLPSEQLDNAIEWLRQALSATAPEVLQEHEDSAAQAEQDKTDKANAKAERERIAAEKAAQPKAPKAPKQSKAERQAAIAAEAAA